MGREWNSFAEWATDAFKGKTVERVEENVPNVARFFFTDNTFQDVLTRNLSLEVMPASLNEKTVRPVEGSAFSGTILTEKAERELTADN